jgi:putative transposase
MRKSIAFECLKGLSPLDKEVNDLEKARTCAFQANYHLICATKYRRKVLVGAVEVRLEGVLKMIADQCGYRLLAARVHNGDHVHLFVSAPPTVSIPEIVRVFKCVSAKLLFEEFPEIKEKLWGGHLWSEGYAVRTAGVVTSAKIEEYINRA